MCFLIFFLTRKVINSIFMNRTLFLFVVFFMVLCSWSQKDSVKFIRMNRQKAFHGMMPAGNYSGIASLGQNMYAVVSDKSDSVLWYRFQIDIDSVTGQILRAVCLGAGAYTAERNLDIEGVTYTGKQVVIASEAENRITTHFLGHDRVGLLSQVKLPILCYPNYGVESLTFDAERRWIWTATESTPKMWGKAADALNRLCNRVPLMAFDDSLKWQGMAVYQMDAPIARHAAQWYAMGVSELCAIGRGRLLVLERELYVPQQKIGAWVSNKLYCTDSVCLGDTMPVGKYIVHAWKTKFNLTNHSFANYEGMCLGPHLKDGSQTIILVADSQNRYKHLLKDWFCTLVVRL